ncbi:hypothetical protein S245_034792, partial [Arachis hypogaea]
MKTCIFINSLYKWVIFLRRRRGNSEIDIDLRRRWCILFVGIFVDSTLLRMLGVSRASRRATRFRTTRSRRGIIQMRGSLLWRKFGTFIDSSVEDSFCDEERDL